MVTKAKSGRSAAIKAESFKPLKRRAPKRAPKALARMAAFVESMECLGVKTLPEGPNLTYEIKLDGFRLEAVKTEGKTTLYSRRGNVLNAKFQYIPDALKIFPTIGSSTARS
jgi:ATP-dependent DNA ligase